MMLLSYKYRLNPTKDQIVALEEQLQLCRWTYNGLLNHSYEERRAGRGTPTQFSLQNLLPELKTRVPELDQVFSQVLQNIAKRVRGGFEGYWARKRVGLRATPPHFRRARDYSSLTYPQFGFKLVGSTLRLSKIGALRIIQHRPVEGRVKTLTVSRCASGKWYAVFSSEVETRAISNRLPAVGVDLGLNNLVALSDGTVLKAPRRYREAEERLGWAQRSLSRKVRGSGNREKARVKVAKLSERVAYQRRDFACKTARGIVNRYEKVVVEDLKICNMVRNRHLSKSIGDAGWGLLRNALTYMAGLSEGVIAFIDPRYTSQLCSGCGELVPKDLAVRVHVCPLCGLVLDRDVNAARVILLRGIGLERPESTPVGDSASVEATVTQAVSMNQEAHDLSHG